MGFIYPVPGDTTNVWGTALNLLLGLAENHTHEPGKGVQVPTAGLALDADLTFNSFAAIALKAAVFAEVAPAAMNTYSDALYVSSTDHNLYFRNRSAVDVQLTNGPTINMSLIGGIGGDYAAVNALLSYDDATHRYLFQQEGSPRPWAGAAVGNVDIYEQAVGISNRVRLQSPSGLAASYAVTWPAALPGSGSILQIDNAGLLTASNTLANNANLTLQGTGFVKHGDWVRTVALLPQCANASGGGGVTVAGGIGGGRVTSSCTAYLPIADALLDVEQVKTVKIKNQAVGTGNVTLDVVYLDDTLALFSSATAGATAVATGSTGYTTMTVTAGGPPFGGQSGRTLWIKVVCTASNTWDFTSAIITTNA